MLALPLLVNISVIVAVAQLAVVGDTCLWRLHFGNGNRDGCGFIMLYFPLVVDLS